jgi:hypothetical protein
MFGEEVSIFTMMVIGQHLLHAAHIGLKENGSTKEVDGFGYPAIGSKI